jgi:hypothetical protein
MNVKDDKFTYVRAARDISNWERVLSIAAQTPRSAQTRRLRHGHDSRLPFTMQHAVEPQRSQAWVESPYLRSLIVGHSLISALVYSCQDYA